MSSLPDISIRQLEYLVAVEEHPNWAAAAESLGVSSSALSQGLAELERRVGVDLFEREGRRRRRRPAARPVLDHARQVLALTGDLVAWADRIQRARSGSVRLGMIDVAAVAHFTDVIGTYRTARPDVAIHLTVAPSRTLLDQLGRGDIDVAVCVDPNSAIPGISVTDLMVEPLVVVAPDSTTIADPVSWGPWMLFPESSYTRAHIEHELQLVGARVEVAAESHQPDVLARMVELGLGWTVLPAAQVPPDAAVTLGPQLTHRSLVLARRDGAVNDPAVDEVAARLSQVVGT